VYGLDISKAGMVGVLFSLPAAVFRAYGGHLADKYGARRVMYWTFSVAAVSTFLLSYPPTDYVVRGIHGPITFHLEIGLVGFAALLSVLGFFLSLGMAAVFKHIPVYYPNNVGAVGGLVGMIGGLGGFVLPISFGVLNDLTGIWTSCFMLLFLVATISLVWMHLAIRRMERERAGSAPALAAQTSELEAGATS
jgi:NNP family nitrate/nitrite transporter-like MFS transporter